MWRGQLDGANKQRNTDLNASGIPVSSDVPNYKKVQHPIHIDVCINYFNQKIIRRNCKAVVWAQGKSVQVDVSVERLHFIHMTLKYCIGFSEIKHPYTAGWGKTLHWERKHNDKFSTVTIDNLFITYWSLIVLVLNSRNVMTDQIFSRCSFSSS